MTALLFQIEFETGLPIHVKIKWSQFHVMYNIYNYRTTWLPTLCCSLFLTQFSYVENAMFQALYIYLD